MKLKEIFSNFFNRFLNKEKSQAPESLPENSMRNSLKYINGGQLLERRKEQYKSLYNTQITNLLLENGVNPILAKNPRMGSIIIENLGILRSTLSNLKEQINPYEEYSINILQNPVEIDDEDANLIKDYISKLIIENDGNMITMPNESNIVREEYRTFYNGIISTKEYIETDGKDYNILIKEVANPQGKYIARHVNVIESGATQKTDEFTKRTTIDSFADGSYAKEGIYIHHNSAVNKKKDETMENYGQSRVSFDFNISYTKELAHQTVKKLMFNKKYDSQAELIEDKNTGLIYRIKQNVTQKFLQDEQEESEDPQKYYVTDDAKKYFDTAECFKNKAIQLLEKNQIEHELDN